MTPASRTRIQVAAAENATVDDGMDFLMFSDEKAHRATTSIENQLTHGIGHHAGTPFLLRNWQRKIIRDIFGNVDEDGNRLIRTVYIEIPKKSGKSSLAAAVALKLL
jgi:phage terminase large subunit-like protein